MPTRPNMSQLRAATARLQSQARQLEAAGRRAESELRRAQREAEQVGRQLRSSARAPRPTPPSVSGRSSTAQPRLSATRSWQESEAAVLSDAREALHADIERPCDVFISHASADSDVASDLYHQLSSHGLEVWVDLVKLKLGDTLARSIDTGIARCAIGIVLITPTFLAGRFWTEKEMSALITSQKRVIPVLHGVSFSELGEYSPLLSDVLGISTENHSIADIAEKVAELFE